MKAPYFDLKKLIVVGSASVFALLAVPMVSDYVAGGAFSIVATAQAAEAGHDSGHDSGSGHTGSGKGKGGSAQGQQGKGSSHAGGSGGASKSVEVLVTGEEGSGGKGSMGSGVHGQGKYQDNKLSGGGKGAPGEDSDAKGPRYQGGSSSAGGGGKPVWSQEGIPEVELGRLNVARAPSKLLDKSLVTALQTLSTLVATTDSVYEAATLADALAMLAKSVTRIDSPIENLAMLKDFLADGLLGSFDPTMSDADFAALLLGSAADKTVSITSDTVKAMSILLSVTFPDSDAAIATSADLVRSTINTAHGDK